MPNVVVQLAAWRPKLLPGISLSVTEEEDRISGDSLMDSDGLLLPERGFVAVMVTGSVPAVVLPWLLSQAAAAALWCSGASAGFGVCCSWQEERAGSSWPGKSCLLLTLSGEKPNCSSEERRLGARDGLNVLW